MGKLLVMDTQKKYVLQHIYTGDYVTRTKAGKRAEYTFTSNRSEATHFSNDEAVKIIAATATDNGKDDKDFAVIEQLRGVEI